MTFSLIKFIVRSTINVRKYNIVSLYFKSNWDWEREREREIVVCVPRISIPSQIFGTNRWRFYWCFKWKLMPQLHQSSYCYGVSHEFNIHAIKRSMVVEEFNHSWSGMWSCNKSYIVGNISKIYISLYCCTSILL